MQKASTFKVLPRSQVSDDLLWAINGSNNCFIRKSQGVRFSVDPCNLSGLNLKRDSGITSQEGLGITINRAERKVKEKKSKKRAQVVRFNFNVRSRRNLSKPRLVAVKKNPTSNNRVYSTQSGVTTRSILKTIRRSLGTYRPDLHRVAFKKLTKLNALRLRSKYANRAEVKGKK